MNRRGLNLPIHCKVRASLQEQLRQVTPAICFRLSCTDDVAVRPEHADLAFSTLTCHMYLSRFLSGPEWVDELAVGDDVSCCGSFALKPELPLT